jgi:hypothetical protein
MLNKKKNGERYVEWNMAWYLKEINAMKHTSKYNEFINMCKIISEFNKKNNFNLLLLKKFSTFVRNILI